MKNGRVRERFNRLAWKASVAVRRPWVRIPPLPPQNHKHKQLAISKSMDPIEEIKQKIDVVDLVGSYIPLKQAGRNFKALCPFHSEKTSSFVVSPEKQIWHCFGCGEGGDIFGFVEKKEGVDFSEALRMLAQRAGVTLTRINPALKNKKSRLYEINELATLYFYKKLQDNDGKVALEYLKKRGVTPKIIQEFKIGFAPVSSQTLLETLLKRGFGAEELLEAGIATKREGKLFGLFRGRITFPFLDSSGGIVGFSARGLREQDMPKYLNTPSTLLFDKSKSLYGLSQAKEAIRTADEAVFAEGQMDVLASHQADVKNVVCSSGTALTSSQIAATLKLTKNISLAFDADSAGSAATKRGVGLALGEGANVKIITLKFGKDPDECIKKDPKLWRESITEAKHAIDFYQDSFIAAFGKPKTIEQKRKFKSEIFPFLGILGDKIEQGHFAKKTAEILEVPLPSVLEEVLKYGRKESKGVVERKDYEKITENSVDIAQRRILSLILVFPENLKHVLTNLEAEDFDSPEHQALFKTIQHYYTTSKSFNLEKFLKEIEKFLQKHQQSDGLGELAIKLSLGVADLYKGISEQEIAKEVESYLVLIKKSKLITKQQSLTQAIRDAEGRGDKEEVAKLLGQFQKLVKGGTLRK